MGIREVTRRTSQVIHQAAAGETVVITEHDRPIAMLVPLPKTGDEVVDEMIMRGELTPASNPGGTAALLAFTPVEDGDDGIDSAEIISQLREERL